MRGPTTVLTQHSVDTSSNSRQSPQPAFQYRAGSAPLRVPDFAWILPSALDASGYYPLAGISAHHWASSGGPLPVQTERRHNRDIPSKGSAHAQDAFHQHPDEGERPPAGLLPLTPGARMYGRRQGSKANREPWRARNRHRKTMDHARQPGSTDRLRGGLPPSRKTARAKELWRARKDRTRSCQSSGDVRWRSFRLAKVWPVTDRQSSSRSRFEWRTRPPDRGHTSAPIGAGPCAHRPT